VDGGLFATANNAVWIQQQIKVLQEAYTEITIKYCVGIRIVVMQVSLNCHDQQEIITKPK
jgi:hypothetical protein